MKCQFLPKEFKPVTNWKNRDTAFTEIAKGIRDVAVRIQQQKSLLENSQVIQIPMMQGSQEKSMIALPASKPISEPSPESLARDTYGYYLDFDIQGIIQRFRWIKPGIFLMGSPIHEAERLNFEVQNEVTVNSGFWLADTAVTQALWQALMNYNPSCFNKNRNNPVENISWKNIQEFITRFNQLENVSWKNVQDFCAGLNQPIPYIKARSPSEAQWEYACRAGTTTPFYFGSKLMPKLVNYDGNSPYAGLKKGRCRKKTVAVKSLPANSWGLYEMLGNVYEWCQDFWADQLPVKPDKDTGIGAEMAVAHLIDPNGPDIGFQRVMRGGSWSSVGREVRSAYRSGANADYCDDNLGFRLALSLEFRPE